ncbi:uncharacterized protein LOC107621489 [Arachis ipaensis]|uniref:uncharacterized protein LOC107621489 n=1 Tax=Arachis ipaensis TaxID=130454 RepID=UPI0007AFA7D0|nr:uncharacterized protein LOC107621489 [Arachis ipaensis]
MTVITEASATIDNEKRCKKWTKKVTKDHLPVNKAEASDGWKANMGKFIAGKKDNVDCGMVKARGSEKVAPPADPPTIQATFLLEELAFKLFAVVDDIFYLFQGHLENVAHLKQQYRLNKMANEVIIVIEAYRTLRDRGPYPAAQVVRDFQGEFAFIPFDSDSKTAFIAADADGCVPFSWRADTDENLVLADEKEVVTKSCGTSSAPFPKGFFFTTSGGLSSFEHLLNEVKLVPRVNNSGQVCGATFKVDEAKKESTGMSRVGSAASRIISEYEFCLN